MRTLCQRVALLAAAALPLAGAEPAPLRLSPAPLPHRGSGLLLRVQPGDATVVASRVGPLLSLTFGNRTLSFSPPARELSEMVPVASWNVKEEQGRLVLRLEPSTGDVDLVPVPGGLEVRFVAGEPSPHQTWRPLRIPPAPISEAVQGTTSPPPPSQPRASGPAAPSGTMPDGEGAGNEAAAVALSAALPEPEGEEQEPVVGAEPPSSSTPHGWGLHAVEAGLELRLIPLAQARLRGEIPEAILGDYQIFVATARVAAGSPWIFRFRQRPDRFRLTLEGGRRAGSLDLRHRPDLASLQAGDPEALFESLDLLPGTEGGGLVAVPRTFELDDVERVEVRIRGTWYRMPPLGGMGGDGR